MAAVDQKYVLILDDEAFYKKDLWDKYTCNSNIEHYYILIMIRIMLMMAR